MQKKDENIKDETNKENMTNKLESVISQILSEISNQNCELEFNPDDPFSRENPSKVSLKYFFGRIKKYSQIDESTIIIILIYIDRMCITSGIILNPRNIHRLILGCLILAIKYNEDFYYNNEYYAKIGGLPLDEFNVLEYHSIQLIEYNLYISDDIYEKYLSYIMHFNDEKS